MTAQQAEAERVERSDAVLRSSRRFALSDSPDRARPAWHMHEREEADRDVEVEDPAPAVVVGDVAAERRPDDRREQRGDAEERLRGALFLRRKRVEQHALARRLQSAAGQALQHARDDQHVEARRHAAQAPRRA